MTSQFFIALGAHQRGIPTKDRGLDVKVLRLVDMEGGIWRRYEVEKVKIQWPGMPATYQWSLRRLTELGLPAQADENRGEIEPCMLSICEAT